MEVGTRMSPYAVYAYGLFAPERRFLKDTENVDIPHAVFDHVMPEHAEC